MREVLVHLNVDLPDGDDRDADAVADAILAALAGLGLAVVCPLAEEI